MIQAEAAMLKHPLKYPHFYLSIVFSWPFKVKHSALTKFLNISSFIDYFTNFTIYTLNFENLNRIELNLFDYLSRFINNSIVNIYLINSDLIFTINGKPIRSCAEIRAFGKGNIKSLFQIPLNKIEKSRDY